MKIDAGPGHPFASQRTQGRTADRPATTSFSAALTQAQAQTQTNGTRRTDFTSMTRKDMRDWVNTQIRSGGMSLDDSRPFMAMTMKIPASGGPGGEVAAENDGTRYDFTQKVRDGIQAALARKDDTTLKMLESAMSTMQGQQGQATSVNTVA